MIHLEEPVTEEKIRKLNVGDMLELSSIVYTGRDSVHKWLHEGNAPEAPWDLKNSILYHCGPVMIKKNGKWVATAAGPTTSMREEPYQAGIIEKFGIRGVIGKGGMGEKTRLACQKFGCVYLHAVGGAAQVLAECVVEVQDVYGLEKFGNPEAIWKLKISHFPVVVTIDSHGNSLHKEIEAQSAQNLQGLLKS